MFQLLFFFERRTIANTANTTAASTKATDGHALEGGSHGPSFRFEPRQIVNILLGPLMAVGTTTAPQDQRSPIS